MKSLGSAAILAVLAAGAAPVDARQPPSPAGRYTAALPSASSAGRQMVLILGADKTASLTTDYKNDKPPIIEAGTWKAEGDRVSLTFTRRDGKATPKPAVLTLAATGDSLTAVKPDPKRWGSEGVTFTRDDAGGLVGGTWHLTKIAHGRDAPIVPKDPATYTLQFDADGVLLLLVDCNRGRGKYTAMPPHLTIGAAATTRMMCPAGSLDTVFLRDLNAVTSFGIEDGELHLTLKDDSGSLTFDRAR